MMLKDRRKRQELEYPEELDKTTWGEHNKKYDGDTPTAYVKERVAAKTPTEIIEFLLHEGIKANIGDGRLAESDEECSCTQCARDIAPQAVHLRIKLSSEDDVRKYCNICFS